MDCWFFADYNELHKLFGISYVISYGHVHLPVIQDNCMLLKLSGPIVLKFAHPKFMIV